MVAKVANNEGQGRTPIARFLTLELEGNCSESQLITMRGEFEV